MDNAGYELFTDLCLADFIVSAKKAKKVFEKNKKLAKQLFLKCVQFQVRFRLKNQPWFVSDTTRSDFEWTVNNLCGENENTALSKLGINSCINFKLFDLGLGDYWLCLSLLFESKKKGSN